MALDMHATFAANPSAWASSAVRWVVERLYAKAHVSVEKITIAKENLSMEEYLAWEYVAGRFWRVCSYADFGPCQGFGLPA